MSLNLDKAAWETVWFGDVVKHVNESVRDASAAGIDRVVGLEHLDPGELQIVRWGEDPSSTTFTKRVRPGQTLFGKRRAYQRKAAYAEFDAVTSGDILTFEAIPERLLPEFLPFLAQSDRFFAHALETSAGSLSPRTNWGDLAKLDFPLPPLDEQRRLADLLWAAEHHRRALQAEVDSARMLAGEIRDALRAPLAPLGAYVARIEAGSSLPGSGRPVAAGEHGVIKVSAVGPRGFDSHENKALVDQSSFLKRASIKRGDLLITRANTSEYVGRTAIVGEDHPELMLSDKTLRLVVTSRATTAYLHEVAQSSAFRQAVKSMATGTGAAMKNLSQLQILALPVPDADASTQSEFLERLDAVQLLSTSLEAEARALQGLRDRILREVFE